MRIRRAIRILLICGALAASVSSAPAWALVSSCEALLTQIKVRSALSKWHDGTKNAKQLEAVYEVVREHLDITGVAYRLAEASDGSTYLEILPNASAPAKLNHWAASLWAKHRTRLIYDLHSLSKRSARATFMHPTSQAAALIRLPTESILNPNQLNSSLAHEMIHSVTAWHLARRNEFALYGSVRSVRAAGLEASAENAATPPELPGTGPLQPGKKTKAYARRFSFDEINTHFGQSSLLWRRLRTAADPRPENLELAKSRSRRGLRLSRQTIHFARTALEAFDNSSAVNAKLKYKLDDGIVWGSLWYELEGVYVRVDLPLIKSDGPSDSANSHYFQEQLRRLEAEAARRALQFERMLISVNNS